MGPLNTLRFEGQEITIMEAVKKMKALSEALHFAFLNEMPHPNLRYETNMPRAPKFLNSPRHAYDALAEHMTGAGNRNEPDGDGA